MYLLAANVVNILCFGTSALVLVVLWIKLSRRSRQQDTSTLFAVVGFSLAAASTLLAISGICYGRTIGGFRHYDPLLMRIFLWGFGLSLAAIIYSLAGVRRRTVLRSFAVALSIITLLFWLFSMMAE
jgi:hypothetical protein